MWLLQLRLLNNDFINFQEYVSETPAPDFAVEAVGVADFAIETNNAAVGHGSPISLWTKWLDFIPDLL